MAKTRRAQNQAVAPEPRISNEVFCAINGYPEGVRRRLYIFLMEAGETEHSKTVKEWEVIYESAMNRVTQ
jgi:hypothetical protein